MPGHIERSGELVTSKKVSSRSFYLVSSSLFNNFNNDNQIESSY